MLHNVSDYRYISYFLLKYATMLNLIDPLFSKMEIYAAKKNWTRILTLC